MTTEKAYKTQLQTANHLWLCFHSLLVIWFQVCSVQGHYECALTSPGGASTPSDVRSTWLGSSDRVPSVGYQAPGLSSLNRVSLLLLYKQTLRNIIILSSSNNSQSTNDW